MSIVCWGAVKVSNILDFRLSQGIVATYCRWGGNLCDIYMGNFLTNHLVKEFWKSGHNCQSYYETSSGLLFWGHGVYAKLCFGCVLKCSLSAHLMQVKLLLFTFIWIADCMQFLSTKRMSNFWTVRFKPNPNRISVFRTSYFLNILC